MSVQLITILALVAAVVVGIVRKVNCGIVAVIFAFIVGKFIVGMSGRELYTAGWPTKIFFLMMALMFLFGIAGENGTLKLLAYKLTYLVRGKNKVLPFLFFVITALLSGLGAGPGIAGLLFPIVMIIALENKISEVLMGVMVIAGAIGGGLSPLAVSGIVAGTLAAEQNVTNYLPIYGSFLLTMVLEAIIAFVVFGGLKIQSKDMSETEKPGAFNRHQIITIAVILAVVVTVLFFKYDIGIVAFVGGAVLVALGTIDSKKAISTVSWDTLILVGGVAMMVNVMKVAGGIDLLADSLSKVMTATTAPSVMVIMGGLMSSVSSSVGVVMPTLIPTAQTISDNMGGVVATSAIISGIVAGSNSVIYSPISTLGAMSLAALPEEIDKEKYFNKMLIVAISSVLFCAVLGLIGLYR